MYLCPMIAIKSVTKDDLTTFLLAHDEKKFRAAQIFEWIWKKGALSFDEMTNISLDTRKLLAQHFTFDAPIIDIIKESTDKTLKVAFRLCDGNYIEGVIIPSADRTTACISSQVGCALACSFCATGTLGIIRNLTFGEIYDQVILLHRLSIEKFGHQLTNIVMMGMGEPLMNYDNVMKSIACMTANWGMSMSNNRITVSTAGLVDKIKQLADDGFKCNLAISLHSADDNIRNELIKINKTNNLQELSQAIVYFHEKTGRRVTLEYLLLNGINDSLDDAKKLAQYCKAFPVKINIIEYNETQHSPFQKTATAKLSQFFEYLASRNMVVTIRASKGQDIDAACGQLVNKRGL